MPLERRLVHSPTISEGYQLVSLACNNPGVSFLFHPFLPCQRILALFDPFFEDLTDGRGQTGIRREQLARLLFLSIVYQSNCFAKFVSSLQIRPSCQKTNISTSACFTKEVHVGVVYRQELSK
jgi:hypothetical protein